MSFLPKNESDDPAWLSLIERVTECQARMALSTRVRIIKIDNWFGPKWYTFAGKALGAVSIHDNALKVPPFHPNRVISEMEFSTSDPSDIKACDHPIHQQRPSEANLQYSIRAAGRQTAFVWYSGQSTNHGRGSLMMYCTGDFPSFGWYAGVEQRGKSKLSLISLLGADRRHWDRLTAVDAYASMMPLSNGN